MGAPAAPIIAGKPEPTYGTTEAEVLLSFLIMSSLLRDAEVLRDAEEPEPT